MEKIVVIGGGFGGLNAVKHLKKFEGKVFLLDRHNHHTFQPLLYQVATSALSAANIASPLREILATQDNAIVLMENVIQIDKKNRLVRVQNGDKFEYDYLILSPGAKHSYFGRNDWEKYAPGLKTLEDAFNLRDRILLAYEEAERVAQDTKKDKSICFAIVGGGPTGVELAGAIAEIATKSLIKNFHYIKPEHSKILLIEGEGQILPSYPKDLANKAQKYLENMGVKVLLNSKVTDMNENGVLLNGEQFLKTSAVIWAAGNAASPLLKTLEVPLDRTGRVFVKEDLSIPGHPEIFVIGDAAHAKDKNNQPLPGIAPVAIQQGRYVAKLIMENASPEKRKPFQYFDKGNLATIGKDKAVGLVGKKKVSGYFAWLTWSFVHIFYLISFPNRLLVLIQWFFWYLTNQRRVRIITRPIEDYDFK